MPENLSFNLLIAYGLNVLGAIATLVAGWLVAAWTAKLVARVSERSPKIDRALSQIFAKVVRIAILAFTLIAVLNRFGVETTALVALVGAAGLAVGLALQGTLGHVAAGVVILGLRPFRIGDAVEIGGTMGIVEEVGLFVCKLKTFDGVAVRVPNGQIVNSEIKNFSENDTRRADMVFGIGYDDDMDAALAIIKEELSRDERVLPEPEPLVAVGELGDSSVDLWVRPWVKRSDFLKVKLDLTKRVKERFDEAGITIPYPQRDVHLFTVSSEAEVVKEPMQG